MNVVDHLKAVPLFQGMTEPALEAVAGLASEIRFEAGQELTVEGEPGDSFYVVVDGQLRVSRHGTPIRDLGPGDFLGEISLIDGRPRSATTVAIGPVDALVIKRSEFQELMDRFGAIRLEILMGLTDRIRSDERESLI